MTRTVSEAFQFLLQCVEPSQPEDSARRTHARTIEQGLATEFKAVAGVDVIGSYTRATAIHMWSDVDYLAKLSRDDVIRGGEVISSTTILSRVKRAMEARFPQTEVEVDGPAVVVHFGQGNGAVDIVPAYYAGSVGPKDGYPKFGIPDGDGGWRATSPQKHGKYVKDADERAWWKLSPTVRLLKVWKYARTRGSVPRLPLRDPPRERGRLRRREGIRRDAAGLLPAPARPAGPGAQRSARHLLARRGGPNPCPGRQAR